MLNQFDQHCSKYGLIPGYQSVYRKNFSCETALIKIINDCLWNMENQRITAIVAIDLSATFDAVDHQILTDVLNKRFNIEGVALELFSNYLSPRSCKLMVLNRKIIIILSPPRQHGRSPFVQCICIYTRGSCISSN